MKGWNLVVSSLSKRPPLRNCLLSRGECEGLLLGAIIERMCRSTTHFNERSDSLSATKQ